MRFFTILLISVCALVGSMRVIADDALSTLIGDDKVWNYHSDIYSMDKLVNSYDSYSLQCKGTVEKNGMTYSIVFLRNENEEIAYIREEDGKLFISSDSPVFRRGVSGNGTGYIDPEFEDIQEFPVFDFNAKEGEAFQGLVNHIYGYRIGEIEVERSETKNVNGRDLKILTVTLKSIRESVDGKYVDIVGEETVVEGIGYLKEWFFLPEVGDFTTSIYGDPVDSWFKSITDEDGNEIIARSQIFPPIVPTWEYAPTIRTDRTWVYSFVKDGVEHTKSLYFGDKIHNDYGYYHQLIDEKGEVVANMTYFYRTNSIICRYTHDNQGISDLMIGIPDDGEYFVYCFDGQIPLYETFILSDKTGKYRKEVVTVEDTEIINVAGEKCHRQIVSVNGRPNEKFVVIEGIGADTGWLYEPAWGDREAEEANGLATLREVLDGEGNVIFRHEDFGPTNAVEGIEDDCAAENDTRMFDLFGREIRDPQPGTVYVRGGRKFVVR